MAQDGWCSSRTPLIVGNWKMFKTSAEGAAFVRDLAGLIGTPADRQVMVAPPFTGLYEAARAADGTPIGIAAQDLFWEWEGAYTGEVSASMLLDLGVSASIIGHSERRRYFGETDEWVAKKVWAAIERGLLPIMCVGETEDQREAGLTEAVLSRQIPEGLASARPQDAAGIAIAYEPVWAIGTGKTATPEIAQAAHETIKELLDVPVLYGGSVKPDNAAELLAQPAVDGALVGGASLDVDSFVAICRAAA